MVCSSCSAEQQEGKASLLQGGARRCKFMENSVNARNYSLLARLRDYVCTIHMYNTSSASSFGLSKMICSLQQHRGNHLKNSAPYNKGAKEKKKEVHPLCTQFGQSIHYNHY
uniref:Uncharacterized protein n=1 Tax=Pseudo-nitzschia australis TaxID=44445 RepID=A0A6V0D285_9STRA